MAGHVGVVVSHLRREGGAATRRKVRRFLATRLRRRSTVARRRDKTFSIGSAKLPYELGRHNAAWLTERTVEIAVAKYVLDGIASDSVLEVGNVLANFGRSGHTVVDKYDDSHGVLNEDILDYHPDRTFAALVAVSTLEHVGYDRPETPDPDAPVRALAALRRLVGPDGVLLVTVPIGYNAGLDAAIADRRFSCERQFFLQRVSADNDWVETDLDQALMARYGSPYADGNAVLVGLDGAGSSAARL